MTGPLLEARGLVKRYGALLVTDGVDLTVEPGELHAIIGPNGAGKSTLIAQLAGELAPDAGTIRLGGEEVTRLHAPARALKGLARSYQVTSVFPDLTVLENVALALQAHAGHSFRFFRPILGETRLTDPAHAALGAVGLAARAGDRVEDLAHGERRQLEVAMGLAANPKLLLLDEPMAGMSRPETQSIVTLLQGLKGRFAILLVEHDMDAVFALADRISVLVYGRLIASGTPAEIRRNADVVAAYLGEEVG